MTWNPCLWINHVVIEEPVVRCRHFAMLRGIIVFASIFANPMVELVTGSLKIKDCKGTDIAETVDMDSKLPKEVDDLVAAVGKGEE